MKTTSIFRGAATALVTPLTASGVDYEAFGRLSKAASTPLLSPGPPVKAPPFPMKNTAK